MTQIGKNSLFFNFDQEDKSFEDSWQQICKFYILIDLFTTLSLLFDNHLTKFFDSPTESCDF